MTRSAREIIGTYGQSIQHLHDSALASITVRVALRRPLTRNQFVVAALLAEMYSQKEIAAVTGIMERTVRWHIRRAADRIPGDLPPTERVRAWYRGASVEVLCGQSVFDPLPERQTVSAAAPAVSSSLPQYPASPAHPE